jgi:nucleoid DNA-binding protein
MTKAKLIDKIAQEANISKKEAALAIGAVINAVYASLKGKDKRIRIPGLGSFKIVRRKARLGVNPRTQERIQIPATKSISFVPFQALKDSVREKVAPTAQDCDDIEGTIQRMLCKVCGMPALGALPFCKKHTEPHS